MVLAIMKNNTVILNGSSRTNGDASKIIHYINSQNQFDVIHLKTKKIGHFDYDFNNSKDDFIPLMEKIILNYDTILFVTPVYWYSMSGHLKVFFDRISDLLKTHKELGRKLRGKNMAMISVNNANDLKSGFAMPFIESANYLGMRYLGNLHTWVENDSISTEVKKNIKLFSTNFI